MKVGDQFIGELLEGRWVIFSILTVGDDRLTYKVEGSKITRSWYVWNEWVKNGEMIPLTKLTVNLV